MHDDRQQKRSVSWWKLLLLALLVGFVAFVYYRYRDSLTLSYLAEQEAALKRFQADHPLVVYGAAFLAYVVVTGLSLPGATIMTLFIGWYFGLVRGVILVSFASTLGATLAFSLSRYLLRPTIEARFGKRVATFNEALEREGAFYLFTLRLIPAVPFFVINVVMGLTRIRLWTFWWVSQLGMLAGTVLYTYVGSSVPELRELAEHGAGAILNPRQLTSLAVAFTVLGLFPLIIRKVVQRVRQRRVADD